MRRSSPLIAALVLATTAADAAPTATGFASDQKADRLPLTHAGRPVADSVFSDPQILRPHFQNLRAPSGVQVTRNHPPAAGGKLVIKPGEALTLRYGVLLFDTPAASPVDFAAVNQVFQTTRTQP